MAKGLIRTTVQGCLLGAGLYLGADVVGEYTTYLRLRDAALEFAETSEELRAQIGHPYSIGPWYNASIGISHAGHIAAVRFQLQGQAQVRRACGEGAHLQGFTHLLQAHLRLFL